MGKANLYTVKDYRTGEVLAKGRAGELEASGIVPKGYHTSEWAKRENNRTMGRKYNISSELLHPEDSPRRGEKGRTMNVYTCYDAAGNVMGEGTSRELWETGVFGDDNGAYSAYNPQGGRCIKRGIAKMTRRKEVRQVSMHNARSDKPPKPKSKKPKLPVLRRISSFHLSHLIAMTKFMPEYPDILKKNSFIKHSLFTIGKISTSAIPIRGSSP